MEAAASAGKKPSFRRKKYWIDSSFQSRYIAHLFLMALLMTGLSVGIMVLLILHGGGGEEQALRVVNHLPRLALEMALVSLVFLPLAGVFLSHRIAGPAYRFRQSLQRMARGDYAFRIHLRRFDQMKETAECFNACLAQMEEDRAKLQGRIHGALKLLEEGDEEELPEVLRLLEEAESALRPQGPEMENQGGENDAHQ